MTTEIPSSIDHANLNDKIELYLQNLRVLTNFRYGSTTLDDEAIEIAYGLRQANNYIHKAITKQSREVGEFLLTMERFDLVVLQMELRINEIRQSTTGSGDSYLTGLLDKALCLADYSRYLISNISAISDLKIPAVIKDQCSNVYCETMAYGLAVIPQLTIPGVLPTYGNGSLIPNPNAHLPGAHPHKEEPLFSVADVCKRIVDKQRYLKFSPTALLDSTRHMFVKEIYSKTGRDSSNFEVPTGYSPTPLFVAEKAAYLSGGFANARRELRTFANRVANGNALHRYNANAIPEFVINPKDYLYGKNMREISMLLPHGDLDVETISRIIEEPSNASYFNELFSLVKKVETRILGDAEAKSTEERSYSDHTLLDAKAEVVKLCGDLRFPIKMSLETLRSIASTAVRKPDSQYVRADIGTHILRASSAIVDAAELSVKRRLGADEQANAIEDLKKTNEIVAEIRNLYRIFGEDHKGNKTDNVLSNLIVSAELLIDDLGKKDIGVELIPVI